MSKAQQIFLGAAFILAGGLIYTIERMTAHLYWVGQINTGTWDTMPKTYLFENLFTSLFLLMGIILMLVATREFWMKHLFNKSENVEAEETETGMPEVRK